MDLSLSLFVVRGPEAEAVSALFFVFWKKKKCEGAKLRVEGSKQKLRHGQIPKATRVEGLPRWLGGKRSEASCWEHARFGEFTLGAGKK